MYSARKIIAVLLVAVMVFAMNASAFAASGSYSDLKDHWSKPFIEDLVDRGMLAGYTDGTMRPDRDITGAEALVFLSHLYELSEKENAAVYADFGKKAESITSTKWVQPFLAICLAAGIADETELKAIELEQPIEKELLSLFLVRAMQMDDTAAALADTELSFPDAGKISTECRGSVALLAQLKIVSGNTKGEFTPQAFVTRAVVATMVSNILKYLESNDIELKIAGYSGLANTEGLLTSASTKGITIKDAAGVDHFYKIASGFTVTVGGATKALSTSYVGDYIKVRLVDGVAAGAEIVVEDKTSYITGTMTSKDKQSENIYVYELMSGFRRSYNVMEAAVYLDGVENVMAKVENGAYVVLKVVDNVVTEVRADSKGATFQGTISAIEYGNPVVMNVTNAAGETVAMSLKFSELPTITRGNTEVGIDKLAVGDSIKVVYEGGYVSEIVMDVTSATLSGTITAISQTINGTTWVITKEDGATAVHALAKNVVAYSGKSTIKVSAISVGDEVSVIVLGEEITEVTLDKTHSGGTTATSEKISVEVLNVDTISRKIATLTDDAKLLYVDCSSLGSILVTATGRTITLSAVSVGDKIVVYGSYNEDAEFEAKSIIIEEKQ